MTPANKRPRLSTYLLLVTAFAGVAALACWGVVDAQYAQTVKTWERLLNGNADALEARLLDWLGERASDVELLASSPPVVAALSRSSGGGSASLELDRYLDRFVEAERYAAAYVLDPAGTPVSRSTNAPALDFSRLSSSSHGVGAARVAIIGEDPGWFAFEATAAGAIADPPAGAVIAIVSATSALGGLPGAFLIATSGAETVIARRDGQEIVLLLLSGTGVPPRPLRVSFDAPALVARAALEGDRFGEFRDYRGLPVLAAVRRVGTTGLGLIHKIERSQALAGFRRTATLEAVVAGLLWLSFAAFLAVERQRRRSAALREEVRHQQGLRLGEERLRALLENASDMIAVIGADRAIRYASPAHERVLGFASQELVGRDVFAGVHRDDLPRVADAFRRVLSTKASSATIEFRYRRKDGSWRDLETVGRNLRDDPNVAGLVFNTRDVTERKRAERALAESEERLRLAVGSAGIGLWDLDMQTGRNVYSDGWKRQLGFAADEIPDRVEEWWDRIHPDDRDRVLTSAADYVGGGASGYEVEFRMRHKDGGYRWIFSRATVLRGEDGRPTRMLGAHVDVTDRKEREERIAEVNAELERRVHVRTAELEQATDEMESFCYSVSHDLRSPLRAIDGFGHALLEEHAARLDPEGRRYLEKMRAASARMGQLIDDLLGLARVARHELEVGDVDLSALAREIAAELRAGEPERDAAIAIDGPLLARGDARLLRVALENLLRNAWKYSGREKPPRIEFGAVPLADGAPRLAYFVRDHGVGFDPAYADELFQPFHRLHSEAEFEGTGIGLAIVARIVARHRGRVWAAGRVGEGATFYFTLGEDGAPHS